MDSFHLFDRDGDLSITYRQLPHWSQPGAVAFLTWRTNDSMPKEVLDRWFDDRRRWLTAHGIDVSHRNWQRHLERLDPKLQNQFRTLFWNKWHDQLDLGHGKCILRQPHLSEIVATSLLHADGQKYLMLDHVVMPNHVHMLAAFPTEKAMLDQCEAWKRFTARQINQQLGTSGEFWASTTLSVAKSNCCFCAGISERTLNWPGCRQGSIDIILERYSRRFSPRNVPSQAQA